MTNFVKDFGPENNLLEDRRDSPGCRSARYHISPTVLSSCWRGIRGDYVNHLRTHERNANFRSFVNHLHKRCRSLNLLHSCSLQWHLLKFSDDQRGSLAEKKNENQLEKSLRVTNNVLLVCWAISNPNLVPILRRSMSEATKNAEPTNSAAKAKPEIQRYSVSKGKYSARLHKNDRPPANSAQGNVKTSNQRYQNNNQYYQYDSYDNGHYSSYYDDQDYYYDYHQQYPSRSQQKPQNSANQTKKVAPPVKETNDDESEMVRSIDRSSSSTSVFFFHLRNWTNGSKVWPSRTRT